MNTVPRQTPTLLELQRWMAAQIVNRDRLDAFTPDAGAPMTLRSSEDDEKQAPLAHATSGMGEGLGEGRKLFPPPIVEGHCSELIAVPERGTAVERLRVYAGGYPVRVQDALWL